MRILELQERLEVLHKEHGNIDVRCHDGMDPSDMLTIQIVELSDEDLEEKFVALRS